MRSQQLWAGIAALIGAAVWLGHSIAKPGDLSSTLAGGAAALVWLLVPWWLPTEPVGRPRRIARLGGAIGLVLFGAGGLLQSLVYLFVVQLAFTVFGGTSFQLVRQLPSIQPPLDIGAAVLLTAGVLQAVFERGRLRWPVLLATTSTAATRLVQPQQTWLTPLPALAWALLGVLLLHTALQMPREVAERERFEWRELGPAMVSRRTLITGLGMAAVLSIAIDWQTGIAITLLLYAHELGHVLFAFARNVRVTRAPTFLPGLGAFITTAPRTDAWDELWVSLGGPLFGGIVAIGCKLAGSYWNLPSLQLAGTFALIVNLFNLLPLGMLDGGKIVALTGRVGSLVGLVVAGAYLADSLSPLTIVLLAVSAYLLLRNWRGGVREVQVNIETRLGALLVYASAFGILWLGNAYSAVYMTPTIRGSFTAPWLLNVAEYVAVAAFAYLLVTARVAGFAWRQDRSALARYALLTLCSGYLLLGNNRRYVPLFMRGAVEALSVKPDAPLLSDEVHRLVAARDPRAGAAAMVGYDVLMRSGHQDSAKDWLEQRTAEVRGLGDEALTVLFGSLESFGHGPAALALLERMCQTHSELLQQAPRLSNTVAWSLLQNGRASDALPWARAAVAGHPDAASLDTLGQVLLALEQYEESESLLRRSLELEPRENTREALARASSYVRASR